MHGTVILERFLRKHRPNRRDIAVAAVVTLVELLAPRSGPPASDPGPALAMVGLILALFQGVPLAWRRTCPVAVLALVTAAFLVHALALYPVPPYGGWVALAALASRREARTAAAATLSVMTAVTVAFWAGGTRNDDVVVPVVLTVAVAAWAQLVRERRARAMARAEQAATEERLRIARDLHDVLGHSLGGIAVQSSTGRLAIDAGQHDLARAALVAIEDASRNSLQEVRTVLTELRDAAAPGLEAVDDVVRGLASGPVMVSVRRHGDLETVPRPVGRVAYRVVQESLTNVVRHAGPCHARVTVSRDRDLLKVEVVDDGKSSTTTDGEPTGHGLVGMAERVATVGGRVVAGPRSDGGWRVRADLPVGGAEHR